MMKYGIDNFDRTFDNSAKGVKYCYSDVIATQIAFERITMREMRIEKPNNWLKRNGYPMRRGLENRFVKNGKKYYILGVDLNHENYKSN